MVIIYWRSFQNGVENTSLINNFLSFSQILAKFNVQTFIERRTIISFTNLKKTRYRNLVLLSYLLKWRIQKNANTYNFRNANNFRISNMSSFSSDTIAMRYVNLYIRIWLWMVNSVATIKNKPKFICFNSRNTLFNNWLSF